VDSGDKPEAPSVLPFIQGLEKLMGNFNVYYSNFYEIASFKRALRDDLTHTREKRLFLYIGAHGSGKKVAPSDYFSGIQLKTILAELKTTAQYNNLEGVVIGSCEIGNNTRDFPEAVTDSHIRWIFGYTCAIDWMASMVIDLYHASKLTGVYAFGKKWCMYTMRILTSGWVVEGNGKVIRSLNLS
jgi:hypothetical protein